ncbi:thiosulfate oxidation carrier protein SoxY [Amphritea sp. 1_MG-2023]|uniref:thiosulfate oxidation carrier protein SoxY n=1 Tax=Amphritea sp. 1_MG-2023 TaxID=3062670 RepID=UPI0026E12A23|nr:thiosulfate oxidation carrier protein SoxY [Amphritea sp. 1_MG-2023]MDO6564947.1 thiosulfate oxidation carrier protein SoxY [Amphritea sp. 1_MG-2023]
MINRRAVIKALSSGGALLGLGVLLPRRAMAVWDQPDFATLTQTDIIVKMFGTEPTESDTIHLKAPSSAIDGSMVPVSVSTTAENVKSISLFIEGNAQPLVAEFLIPEGTQAEVLTRLRLPRTSTITAVVEADGQLLSASIETKITDGDCNH